jgi:hypothetical protein
MSKVIINNEYNTPEIEKEAGPSPDNCEKLNQQIDEFAAAFPEWNLVPPMQVIKRVRRSL